MSDADVQRDDVSGDSGAPVEKRGSAVVPQELLDEAVTQLKSLRELRLQELQRQESFIAEMQSAARSHGRFTRMLLWLSVLVLVTLSLLSLHVLKTRTNQELTALRMDTLATRQDTASELVRLSALQQSANVKAVGETLGTKLETSVEAFRSERDAVRTGVTEAINVHSKHLVDREMALKDEEQHLLKKAEETRLKRLEVIDEAIQSLQSMAQQLETGRVDAVEGAIPAPVVPGDEGKDPAALDAAGAPADALDAGASDEVVPPPAPSSDPA